MSDLNIRFFPVVHLLTGPPGLGRNGGIWKSIKRHLRDVQGETSLMVQVLHFTAYDLSHCAWDDWFYPVNNGNRLQNEIISFFGPKQDIFVDSGGFQLLHSDKIDLSKWGLTIDPECILKLQLKYRPTRIASLDNPLAPSLNTDDAAKAMDISVTNANWMVNHLEESNSSPIPYLVVHGRSPEEVSVCLDKYMHTFKNDWFKKNRYGIALGSQVPLSSNPIVVLNNVKTVISWMNEITRRDTPLHIFGVGDNIIGELIHKQITSREITYDNSSSVQSAFRMRIYDPDVKKYVDFSPSHMPRCGCQACELLRGLGEEKIASVLSRKSYSSPKGLETIGNKSDILGLVTLHNISHWETRVRNGRVIKRGQDSKKWDTIAHRQTQVSSDYKFPLAEYKPNSPNLLVLTCSSKKPYRESISHKRVISYLRAQGLIEGKNYDRITLSGLYGPVHWKSETNPIIMGYDFKLSSQVSNRHANFLRVRAATVFNVIARKYENRAAFIRSGSYDHIFSPILKQYDFNISRSIEDISF